MGNLVDLAFQPGLYTNATDRTARGRWKDADHVRFHNGLPEKIGGWQKNNLIAFDGVCRGCVGWESLQLRPYFGAGTHTKLYVVTGSAFNNITPLRLDDFAYGTDPFTMASGSAAVTVNHSTHSVTAGSTVIFSGATAAHGITIDGAYTVTSVTDSDNYVITHSSNATGSGTGGGASVTGDYEINIGVTDTEPGGGWGSGGWGTSTWGTPRASTAVLERATVWSLDNWGEDMLACRRDGPVYVWDTSVGVSTRATEITQSPDTNKLIKVSDERILVAYGAHDGSNDDAMNVRWCDQEDYTDWTPATTNTAGDKRLDRGNEIIGAASIRGGFLVITDQAAYRQQFLGGDFVFSFQPIAEGRGMLVSPNAMVERDGIVYFMGEKDFYVYDGTIRVLKCDVWEKVFRDFNDDQGFKVYGGHNEIFNEIWWLYSSEGASENDRYVIYNYLDNTWTYGTMDRTAWLDSPALWGVPVGLSSDGYLYLHETGTEDDNDPLDYFIESYDAEVGTGNEFIRVKKMVPDFHTIEGTHTLKLKTRRYPHSSQSTSADYDFTSATEYFGVRHERGRQAAIRIESDEADTHFRMGPWRAEIRTHGRR